MTRHAQRHCTPLPHAPSELRWDPVKSLWFIANAAVFLVFATDTATWALFAIAALTTGACLALGHSVGLHRGLIHRTFQMGRPLMLGLAWLATLTGIGPVLRLMAAHDARDRWQNLPEAPAYYAYEHGVFTDFWWYLHCTHTPQAGHLQPTIPADYSADPGLRFLDASWLLQQIPVAILFGAVFGWGGVVWLACGRVVVCQVGHWWVNYLCHRHGALRFAIDGAGEEGRNNLLFGALSMGEGWHNNHHAWPDSARFGMAWYELDPGFLCIQALERVGLVWGVKTWKNTPVRRTARRMRSAKTPAATG
jgi:sn-1 stearoyl-lipid 9-desaturase